MLNKSILVSTIVAAALAGACTMASIGSVKNSPEVARQFENLQVNPN